MKCYQVMAISLSVLKIGRYMYTKELCKIAYANNNSVFSWFSGEMNSRHYIILAFRNIMKVCCSYDITTLTIPLLLGHEMTEVS